MPRRISILPDAVADQIAAGEVVARPASALKELVENAIDAGATRVRIAIENGGKTLIEVADDGCGMGREDAVLSLDRHATSKIRSAADLTGVTTFGFRGEALPAIGSVSRLTLTTAEEGDEGTELQVVGGRLEHVGPVARQRGATVIVRGLFFNTPARRKFLRSAASESRAAYEAVATLALAHPAVGLEFTQDGQARLAAPPGQEETDRLVAVWGRDLVGTLVGVDYAAGAFRISGFVQRPGDASPTGRRTQLFVNGRPFRDPFLVRAAEAGYRAAIHPGDRPSLYLRIDLAPEEVDVNVHPSKMEVRFRDRIGLERTMEDAVRQAIGALVAAAPVGDWRPMPAGHASLDAQAIVSSLFGDEAPSAPPSESGTSETVGAADPFAEGLTQLFETYIVYQAAEGVVFVDQHSAHERVLFEEVMAAIAGAGAPAQRLLIPATVDLTDEELDALERHRETLERVGFTVEEFGGNTVALHAVPTPHPRFDAVACFQDMIADLARGRFGGWANPLDRFGATYACRAAVKAGQRLSQAEMRELLLRLFATALPPHDVHGRSTIVQLPREELERRFGRR
ncbi:MAG: DNA mismatch repair endonuclease MutL [Gemmatimonadales bacterium]|jgi:DNA mismatch repair protein MutL|nr:MAG: DNA mismatch repair endonuclease MutL [Gemmatimonadales bacterium]